MIQPHLSPLDYALMITYLVAITLLGLWFTRKKEDTEDFLLAGGKVPWWAAAMTFVMALSSTVSLVGTPGEAYNNGLRLQIINWIAPLAAFLCFALFIRFYFMTKTFTPFSYLERRFDVRVRGIVTILYIFSRLSYLALVLFSCSAVFKGAANWEPWVTVLVMGGVCMFYCSMGGFKAVIWTNVIQFVVMWGGLTAAIIACIHAVDGGLVGIIKYSFENGRGYEFDRSFFSFDPHERITIWVLLYSSFFSYMFYCSSDQMALQPLLSTSSYKKAKTTFISSVLMMFPMTAVLFFLGLAMFTYFNQNPLAGGNNPPGDIALFYFVSEKMPAPLPGLVVSAMLAAAVSTVASGLAGTASVTTKDLYLRFAKSDATEQQQVNFSKIATLLTGLICIGLALLIIISSSALGESLIEASAIYIAFMCIIPTTFLVGVLNPRCNSNHALGGMIVGGLITVGMVIWYMFSKFTDNPISFLILQIPGGIGTVLFGLTVPFFIGKKPKTEKTDGLTLLTLKKRQLQTDLEKTLEEQVDGEDKQRLEEVRKSKNSLRRKN